MPQYGYQNGVNLDPTVMDYLMKKKDPTYKSPAYDRALSLLNEVQTRREREASPEYQGMLASSNESSIDPGFVSALAKVSAQAGTIGGKVADTSAVSDMANAVERQRQERIANRMQRNTAQDKFDESALTSSFKLADVEKDQAKNIADQQYRNQEIDLKRRELGLKEKELSGKTNELAFKSLPPEAQEEIKGLSTKISNQVSIANSIDSQLANMKSAYEKGDKGQAIVAGRQMLKVLNSEQGQDAVGAEEAKRLGALLEYQVFNLTQPGPMFGRDVKGFYEQAAQRSNAIKSSIGENRKRISSIYSGKYNEPMQQSSTQLPTFGSAKPDANEAYAAPLSSSSQKNYGVGYKEGDIQNLQGVNFKFTNGRWVEVQ